MLKKIIIIDFVAIKMPSDCHYEHCKDILVTHKKNLISEKPTFICLYK